MGGIFSEGIDLKAERLTVRSWSARDCRRYAGSRELLKNFYDARGEDGFFYAYLCPGMNKVLQSAGRVIRTEADEGVILLRDERFAQRVPEPVSGGVQAPQTCTLQTVQGCLAKFWSERQTERI